MQSFDAGLLVTTTWLAERLGSPGLVVLDGSFKLPGALPTAAEDYRTRHIPGARFFDIDAIADQATSLPHMLPTAQAFAEAAGSLGISSDTLVVVYDSPGLMSAGRVWWTFRVFGHDRVAVLDGGLKKWMAEGRATTDEQPAVTAAPFSACFRADLVRNRDELVANLLSGQEQVVDARSAGRFTAVEKEARPGLRSGHIPGSRNLPFSLLTNPDTGEVLSPADIRRLFMDAGVDLARPIVATCGSGVTAGALAFALALAGRGDVPIYDGAWAEWGMPGPTPVEPG